ncbi:MAG: class I SAM-dependent methyltransferase [Polyangiaceae bacterium]
MNRRTVPTPRKLRHAGGRGAGGPSPKGPRAGGRGADRELEAGATAHYDDATYYTSNYRGRLDDVQFYVDLAVANGGPVLEYACGNGRILLPVARHGVDVTGIDRSEPMLASFRERLADEPRDVRRRVTLRKGDMRTAKVGKRFPLVTCPFNALLHMYQREDVEEFLARVRDHLTPDGRFVVDISVPSLENLMREPTRAFHAPRFRHPTTGELVRYWEHYDYDPVRQVLFVSMNFEPKDRPEGGWMTPLAHRQFFPAEWEMLLHYNGFAIESVWGDFQRGPFDRTSDTMIVSAKVRRTRKRS